MKLVTCNIRCDYDQDGENSFRFRKALLAEKFRAEQPDIICFQEVLPHVAAWLKESLTGYYVIGCGRDADYRGEQVSVAYRPDRLNLMSMETYWLSPTPLIPASRYENQSICPRVCPEAVFEDLSNGKLFRVVSVHLDHEGSGARKMALRQLLEKLSAPAQFADAAVILAGDFNAEPDAEEFAVFRDYPEYVDAAAQSGGTWHDFGRRVPASKIDYIFVKGAQAKDMHVWKDCRDGVWLSDHYPVEAEIS